MSFQQLYDSAIHRAALVKTLFGQVRGETRTLREELWLLANEYCQLQGTYHNEFVQMIHTKKLTVSELFDEWFEPLGIFACNAADLTTAIDKGYSKADYDHGLSPATFIAEQNGECRTHKPRTVPALIAELRNDLRRLRAEMKDRDRKSAVKITQLQRRVEALIRERDKLLLELGKPLRRVG